MTEIRAQYFVKKEDGLVHCLLCPHNCHIKKIRGNSAESINIDGDPMPKTYGRHSYWALDPLRNRCITYPGSYILSVGSYGCNFSCSFCQNNGISFGNPQTTYISPEILVDKAFSLKDSGNIGLAYTYNEPFISYEYVLDCCRLIKEKKMKNVLITNGYVQKTSLELLLCRRKNVDLKSFSLIQKICNGRVEHVKDTIRLAANKCHVEVTCLVIPGLNDSPEEIEAMSVWLSQLSPEIPLHLTRFFPRYKMLDKESTSKTVLIKLKEIAKSHLKNVYLGNV